MRITIQDQAPKRIMRMIYHDSGSGLNFITHSPMDNPSFDLPCVFSVTPSNNPTSTKQNVTSSTGMMVAASTGATSSNQIVFRNVDLTPPPAPVGHECDVSPRPNGSTDGTVSIADWVQMGRFVAGLDTPNPGSEFQRADSAPRSTLGDGIITIADWVQCGRYASGLDPVTAAGGPTGPLPGIVFSPQAKAGAAKTQASNGAGAAIAKPTTMNLMSTILPEPNSGQPVPLSTLVEGTSIRNNQ